MKLSLAASMACLALCGCAGETFSPESAPAARVLRERATFYRSGPLQQAPPDALLKRDTVVLVLRKEFGYSLVQLDDGRTGFVANDDLIPSERPQPENAAFPDELSLMAPPPGSTGLDDESAAARDFDVLPQDLPADSPPLP